MTVTDMPVIPEHMVMNGGGLPEGFAMLSIPDVSGDTRIMWDPRDEDDVKTAKKAFKAAKARGMTVYNDAGDNKGEVVHDFPEEAGKLIAVKPLQGG